ncbi:MAG: hypothetical protein DWQ01_10030 [Planctomycetota bacterium]|nr:MAG: hypothetical protein DWQ01_10030 [Planctomycetota bacterium]
MLFSLPLHLVVAAWVLSPAALALETAAPKLAESQIALDWHHSTHGGGDEDSREKEGAGSPLKAKEVDPWLAFQRLRSFEGRLFARATHDSSDGVADWFGVHGVEGLDGYFRVSQFPKEAFHSEIRHEGGLALPGLIPGRNRDSLGLSMQWGIGADAQGYTFREPSEQIFGIFYRFALAPNWCLKPDIQRVVHPKGNPAFPDAWITAIHLEIRF